MSILISREPQGGYRLCCEQWLPASISDVFEFFSDATALEQITPPWLKFKVVTPAPIAMSTGTLIDYELRLYGIPLRWQSEIRDWDPPFRFRDVQLRGPYRNWDHVHTFRETEGGTLVADHVNYSVPGGELVHRFFVKRNLTRIFSYRQEALNKIFAGRRSRNRSQTAAG